jgi:hypothetical protein
MDVGPTSAMKIKYFKLEVIGQMDHIRLIRFPEHIESAISFRAEMFEDQEESIICPTIFVSTRQWQRMNSSIAAK